MKAPATSTRMRFHGAISVNFPPLAASAGGMPEVSSSETLFSAGSASPFCGALSPSAGPICTAGVSSMCSEGAFRGSTSGKISALSEGPSSDMGAPKILTQKQNS